MNIKRRAKLFMPAAAGLGVLLMVSANPVLARGGHGQGDSHGGPHYDRSHDGHHYGHGYNKHHKRRHVRHHRRHHVVVHHRYSDHRSGYGYPIKQSYRSYQQPLYGTSGSYGFGYQASSPNFGNAVGGALGGYLGSKVGKGSGQLAATAAGAIIGYSVGGHVGSQY